MNREIITEQADGTVFEVHEKDGYHTLKRIKPSYFGPLTGLDRLHADYSVYGHCPGRNMIPMDKLLRIENVAIAREDWSTVSACRREHWLRNHKELFDDEWERIGRKPSMNWDLPPGPSLKDSLDNPAFIAWLNDPEALAIIKEMIPEDHS